MPRISMNFPSPSSRSAVTPGMRAAPSAALPFGSARISSPERTVTILSADFCRSSAVALDSPSLSDPGNQPIANAEIAVSSALTAHSDAAGTFRIRGIPPGTYQVMVRRLGYKPLETALTFVAGDSVGADITLKADVPVLDSVAVNARQAPPSPIALGKMAALRAPATATCRTRGGQHDVAAGELSQTR